MMRFPAPGSLEPAILSSHQAGAPSDSGQALSRRTLSLKYASCVRALFLDWHLSSMESRCHGASRSRSAWTGGPRTVSRSPLATLLAQERDVPAVRFKPVDDARLNIGY